MLCTSNLRPVMMAAAAFAILVQALSATAADKTPAKGAALRAACTFYASFDQGTDADVAHGDRRLYSAATLNGRKDGQPGLPASGAVTIEKGVGRFGDALRFHRNVPEVVCYRIDGNLPYSQSRWNGAVSFWLKLDPNKDLEPGYCDPLFITPRVFNDGALWVDFSDKPPRALRHGAIPDRHVWNPAMKDFDKIPDAERPLASVASPPFAGDRWTHIVVSFENFNTGKPDGVSKLYLNGKLAGSVGPREQTYTWDPHQTTATLGINYIGLYDELAFFQRALTAAEVAELYEQAGAMLVP